MPDAVRDIPATGEAVRDLFARQEVVEVVRETLRGEGRASVEGLWGSSAPALAAALLPDCPSTLLYVLAHTDSVDDAADDWRLFAGLEPVVFPAWEALPAESDVSDEILAERLRVLKWLAEARRHECGRGGGAASGAPAPPMRYADTDTEAAAVQQRAAMPPGDHAAPSGDQAVPHSDQAAAPGVTGPPRVLVTTIQAMMQPVPSPRHLEENTVELVVGQDYSLPELRAWLAVRGFRPAELVLEPGQYAARGGIIDVFPPTAPVPYRLEFFGDTLESLRTFDPTTQRSLDDRQRAAILFLPTGKGGPIAPETSANLMDYLPRDAWIVWQDPLEIAEVGRSFITRLASPVGVYAFEAVVRQARAFWRLDLSSFISSAATDAFTLRTEGLPPFSGKAEAVRQDLADLAADGAVLLFSDNEGERDRLAEILATLDPDVAPRIRLGVGRLGAGFRLVSQRVTVLANHEIFQRYQTRRRIGRRIETRAIDTWLDLKRGDYVVHVVHGIGRYLGMKTLRRGAKAAAAAEVEPGEKAEDHLTLEFRDHVKVYVPASQVDLVQKYIGGFKGKPQLSRVGGKAWGEKKRRVEAAVQDYAVELLRVQALRQSRPGIAYPEDSLWQKEFEASFPYPETADQTAAMREIKRDMQSQRPMDRLVCGDVGYGKTELAIRAAFKAVDASKQVVILVPTTVLAEQHVGTFRERMADYPVITEMLCRFQTRAEQARILERFRKGQVDVLIGTHRLLQSDVAPADLGLLVVDEEQRFGVEHKERLKGLRQLVDVLTLTATPIPRTLHMSLLGIRDISSLTTAPQDRRAVRTEVCPWDDGRIRAAILRELNRDGQVFFVHNRVRTIAAVAERVKGLVPEARVEFAHGQMNEHELEERMLRFFGGRIDVLVSTTIIESGLDVPRANTMFIHDADRFGLADLHQLRGRVGRYKHRAYCYLLLPENRPVTPSAAKRLHAIEQYAELGAGFQIAMRDLEIRGAGNILGLEQSGHINAVGYEMYCQLLDAAVRRLKGEKIEEPSRADVQLELAAFIPPRYVPTESQRIRLYRQLQRAATAETLEEIAAETDDVYGPMPEEVRRLVDLEAVRVAAGKAGIRSIHRRGADLTFTLQDVAILGPMLGRAGDPEISGAGVVRVLDPHTAVWRLHEDRGPIHALTLLKKVLARPVAGK
jgi:transcription-repair coupling factor (superfamily II helicase)